MSELGDVTVIYAIRYCLSRKTYAFVDGLTLIEQHLDLLIERGWVTSVLADLDDAISAGRALDAQRACRVLDHLREGAARQARTRLRLV